MRAEAEKTYKACHHARQRIGKCRFAAGAILLLSIGIPELFALQMNARMPLDVVVQDSSGNPVNDLAPADFDVNVDGHPLPVNGVEFVGGGSRDPRGTFSPPFSAPGDALRSVVILIDDLGIGERARQNVRTAIGAVEQGMQPGDAVAIVTTGDAPTTLPKLSANKNAISEDAANIVFSARHRPGILDTGFCQRPDAASSVLQTASVVRRAVNALRDLPGRKSMVLISEGFGLQTTGVSDAWKDLLLYANRADVDISTVDPRGVVAPSLPQMDCGSLRARELSASRRTLAEIAEATSGVAVANTSDLREALSRLMRRGSEYYLIGYQVSTPSTNTAPSRDRNHAVSIHVKRPGAVAFYHSSVFESRAGDTREKIGAAIDSPFALPGIRTSVHSRFWDDSTDGPVIQSVVWIDARDLSLVAKSDGGSEITFGLEADTLDESSHLLDHFVQTYKVDVPAAFRQTVLGDGLTQRLRLPVKNPGLYQVRVAVDDRPSDRTGSDTGFVAIPDLTKRKLALSGIVLGKSGETGTAADASPRRFHPGQIVTVVYQIVNAGRDEVGAAGVEVTTSLIHAGTVLAAGSSALEDGARQPDLNRILRARDFLLGEDLEPGIYALRIDAKDRNSPVGSDTATQSIEFEIN